MARSKWIFLIIVVGLYFAAGGETILTNPANVSERAATNIISTTASPSTAIALKTPAPVQTQTISTTVFASQKMPEKLDASND